MNKWSIQEVEYWKTREWSGYLANKESRQLIFLVIYEMLEDFQKFKSVNNLSIYNPFYNFFPFSKFLIYLSKFLYNIPKFFNDYYFLLRHLSVLDSSLINVINNNIKQ